MKILFYSIILLTVTGCKTREQKENEKIYKEIQSKIVTAKKTTDIQNSFWKGLRFGMSKEQYFVHMDSLNYIDQFIMLDSLYHFTLKTNTYDVITVLKPYFGNNQLYQLDMEFMGTQFGITNSFAIINDILDIYTPKLLDDNFERFIWFDEQHEAHLVYFFKNNIIITFSYKNEATMSFLNAIWI